jgi:DNA invertase Pin-like site-specific DNA recombinase
MSKTVPVVRCAIYTRKSSEEGLDHSFNSLDAQREACEAYVKSQAGEGWRALLTAYDDGGFSGGNLERPALKRLMADIASGGIDTVVVYKIDRLTRSLTDFSRIVERFEASKVSFVSVTQAFNTTTSMGRLTLNVLLSFAQFEREVTGERIRDKIAASKARGMWMGGVLPLGYDKPNDPATRALVPNPQEALTIQKIFALYLELGSVHALEATLRADGVRPKVRLAKDGSEAPARIFSRGALFHLLRNRVYLGEIRHGERYYPASHPPLIDQALFDKVQVSLDANGSARRERPTRSATMALKGLLFDGEANPMSPTFSHGRSGKVHRYYVSAPLQQGRGATLGPDLVRRLPGAQIEALVRDQLATLPGSPTDASLQALLVPVVRIEVEAETLRIFLKRSDLPRAAQKVCIPVEGHPERLLLEVSVRCRLRGGRSWILPAADQGRTGAARRDLVLIRRLMQAHDLVGAMGWQSKDGSLEGRAIKAPAAFDRRLCRLAFLAPNIQRAILEGRQPPGLNLETLIHGSIPADWSEQRRLLGFV